MVICCPLPIIMLVIAVDTVIAGTLRTVLNDRLECGQPKLTSDWSGMLQLFYCRE